MGSNKARTWTIATAFVVVLILVVGWFLAVSPLYAEAGETRDQTASVQGQNDLLRIQNAELRRQFDALDETRAELADYQVAIPIAPELSDFQREIDRIAAASGVLVTDIQVSQAQVADTTVVAAPETPTTGEGTDDAAAEGDAAEGDTNDEAEDAATEPPADTGSGAPLLDGLYTIQVTVTVFGQYPATRQFVAGMQTQIDRTYYVPSLAIARQEPAPQPNQGLPPINLGDVKLTLSGLVFVLPAEPALPPEDPEEPVEPPVLPPSNNWNWWVPIPGTAIAGVTAPPTED